MENKSCTMHLKIYCKLAMLPNVIWVVLSNTHDKQNKKHQCCNMLIFFPFIFCRRCCCCCFCLCIFFVLTTELSSLSKITRNVFLFYDVPYFRIQFFHLFSSRFVSVCFFCIPSTSSSVYDISQNHANAVEEIKKQIWRFIQKN